MMSFNQSKHVNTKTFGHISMVQHLMVKQLPDPKVAPGKRNFCPRRKRHRMQSSVLVLCNTKTHHDKSKHVERVPKQRIFTTWQYYTTSLDKSKLVEEEIMVQYLVVGVNKTHQVNDLLYCRATTSQTSYDESKEFIDFSDQTATPQKLVEMSCGLNGHPIAYKPQGSSSDPETQISKNIAQLFF